MTFKDQNLLTQIIFTASSHTFLSKTRLLFVSFVLLWAFVKLCALGLVWVDGKSKVLMSSRPARRNSVCAEEPLMLFFFAFVPSVQM